MEKLAKNEVIGQVPFTVKPEDSAERFENLGDFLDHVELGVPSFVREMIQTYAEDEFRRYIGAKPYERTPNRKDHRS